VEAMLEGQTDIMIGMKGMGVTTVPLAEVSEQSRSTALDYYEMAKTLAR
jgi:hypothetical protein